MMMDIHGVEFRRGEGDREVLHVLNLHNCEGSEPRSPGNQGSRNERSEVRRQSTWGARDRQNLPLAAQGIPQVVLARARSTWPTATRCATGRSWVYGPS